MSVAVGTQFPAVLLVIAKVSVPPDNAVLAGNTSLGSVAVRPTVCVLLTTFQSESTALIVTLKEAPAVWALGAPVLPVEVPGAAISPGSNICNLTKLLPLTGIEVLVLAVIPAWVTSLALTVELGAVLRVTLKLRVPPAKAASDGKAAFVSLEVMCTVSFVLRRFQFTSTALT